MSSVPPLNYEAQAEYIIPFGKEERSTLLRQDLYRLERILYIESLPHAEVGATSYAEDSCPICCCRYTEILAGLDTISTEPQQEKIQYKWLPVLGCKHVLCSVCLHELLNRSGLISCKCPFCEFEICPHTLPDNALAPRADGPQDRLAILCSAIREFLILGSDNPETYECLEDFIYRSSCETGYGPISLPLHTILMKQAVESWLELGLHDRGHILRNRERGKPLPGEEDRSNELSRYLRQTTEWGP